MAVDASPQDFLWVCQRGPLAEVKSCGQQTFLLADSTLFLFFFLLRLFGLPAACEGDKNPVICDSKVKC